MEVWGIVMDFIEGTLLELGPGLVVVEFRFHLVRVSQKTSSSPLAVEGVAKHY